MAELTGNILTKQAVEEGNQRNAGAAAIRSPGGAASSTTISRMDRNRNLKIAFQKPVLIAQHIVIDGNPDTGANADDAKEPDR